MVDDAVGLVYGGGPSVGVGWELREEWGLGWLQGWEGGNWDEDCWWVSRVELVLGRGAWLCCAIAKTPKHRAQDNYIIVAGTNHAC